jgi:hypothetical protein
MELGLSTPFYFLRFNLILLWHLKLYVPIAVNLSGLNLSSLSRTPYRSLNVTVVKLGNCQYYDWAEKYNNYIWQHRYTSQSKPTPLNVIIFGSSYIFQLNRSINCKWARLGLCHWCIQWAICPVHNSAFHFIARITYLEITTHLSI